MKKILNSIYRFIELSYSVLPFPGISRPVFILGCGRSGTTIIAKSLSIHSKVAYLNEPRNIWYSCYPITGIWLKYTKSYNGKMILDESDVETKRTRKLSRMFRFRTITSRKPVLIEKLPINNFRLKFIYKMFPDARFIYIHRNGIEVARSIEKCSLEGRWFGSANSGNWRQLVTYANSRDDTFGLPELCGDYYKKGLLFWNLSTKTALEFLYGLPGDTYHEVSYDTFVDNPVEVIGGIIRFLRLEEEETVNRFVRNNVSRRSEKIDMNSITEQDRLIGGERLFFENS